MKRVWLFFVLAVMLIAGGYVQSVQAMPEEETVFTVVDTRPKYPGGEEAFMKYLAENIVYPEEAKANKVEGRTILETVIEKDGSVTVVKVLRSSGNEALDNEAIRVVQTIKNWEPGKQRGSAVRVKYYIPVLFKLQ